MAPHCLTGAQQGRALGGRWWGLPSSGTAAGHQGLAGRAQPLASGDAVQRRAQAEQMEGLVALVAQDELLVVSCKTSGGVG